MFGSTTTGNSHFPIMLLKHSNTYFKNNINNDIYRKLTAPLTLSSRSPFVPHFLNIHIDKRVEVICLTLHTPLNDPSCHHFYEDTKQQHFYLNWFMHIHTYCSFEIHVFNIAMPMPHNLDYLQHRILNNTVN